MGEFDLTLLRAPRRITQRFKNIVPLDVGIVRENLIDSAAYADLPDDHPTVTRVPRMHGLPPMTAESCVMRAKSVMSFTSAKYGVAGGAIPS
jgi:hypothetical protein